MFASLSDMAHTQSHLLFTLIILVACSYLSSHHITNARLHSSHRPIYLHATFLASFQELSHSKLITYIADDAQNCLLASQQNIFTATIDGSNRSSRLTIDCATTISWLKQCGTSISCKRMDLPSMWNSERSAKGGGASDVQM